MTYCVPEKPMEKQRTYVNSDFKSVDIKGKAGKPQGKKKSLEQNSRKGARMKINGTEKSGISAGTWNMTQGEDAVSKSIRKQIANAQKALQELSADKELTMEEKMKKRQDLQQQINDLNQQLRQHQVELRRERQRAQKEAADRQEQKGRQEQGLSGASMEAVVSADTAMKQSKSYGSVAARLEGEARVLKSEINLDQDRGQNVEDKLSRLSKVEERAEKATEAQIGILAEAGEKMEKAEEKDREEKAEKTAEKKETEEEKEVSQDRKEKERQEDGKSVDIRL